MTRVAAIVVWVLGAFGGLACGQSPPAVTGLDAYRVQDLGRMPPSPMTRILLRQEPVRDELKLTAAQREAAEAPTPPGLLRELMQRVAKITDAAERTAAIEAAWKELDAVAFRFLEPGQRARLDQIQLQVQGPEAFLIPAIQERVGLSAEQTGKIRPIVEAGRRAISEAGVVPFPAGLKLEDRAGGLEAARKTLEDAGFAASVAKARRAMLGASEEAIRRVEGVLTDAQRDRYGRILGARFDLAKIGTPRDDPEVALRMLANRSGIAGQRADPDFRARVARPAFTATHPTVLFDEAHHNFHTTGERYKPFADLIAGDGYRVVPGREAFTRSVLDRADVLVIANALGAEGMGSPEASQPAFTADECEAVRGWVHDGGALLLISDHPPMGSAAEGLARRFGVKMSRGVALDPKHSGEQPSFLVFSRENALLGDHPITRGRDASERLGKVMTFTGQSLEGPEGSASFLTMGATATDEERPGGEAIGIAGRSQGLALRHGKGRVVVLGEAGQLSAQILGAERRPMGMNVPGIDNRQLALNVMHWLSGVLDPRRD